MNQFNSALLSCGVLFLLRLTFFLRVLGPFFSFCGSAGLPQEGSELPLPPECGKVLKGLPNT